ncbi:hypothetical protein [Cupriavidus oxalaticus]|uniref:Uncharacterized protein n=1 Tax=Cupriavidus oxalaticus TaxID=96344 RepID=A0A4P7LIP8_9BURK|nr:hypothetical protein [Cupriavidus oxalaticus]QBY56030.1 hypothetical protein E0W60_33790 [Cupriavidus oxalaticus]
MAHNEPSLARVRGVADAFGVELAPSEMALVADAHAQATRFGAVGMDTQLSVHALIEAVERRGKAEMNVHAIEGAVYRQRQAVEDWLADPCYDLHETTDSAADRQLLKTFAWVATEAGAPNLRNAMFVLQLERKVAVLETKVEGMADKPTDTHSSGNALRLGKA